MLFKSISKLFNKQKEKCVRKKVFFIKVYMKNCSPEKLAIIATQIAVELARGKDVLEINVIKSVVGQISCALQTIVCQRINLEKKD